MSLGDVAGFEYGDGVGTDSRSEIENMAQRSGIVLTVSSSLRIGEQSYHGTGNAVDFSNGGDAGTPEMDSFANWWIQYAPFLLELIHVNMDGTGEFVKNGQIVDGSFYGAATLAQHHNHVHVAATIHGIDSAEAGGISVGATSGSDPTGGGGTTDSGSTFPVFTAGFWKRVGLGAAGVLIVVLGADVTKRGLHVKSSH